LSFRIFHFKLTIFAALFSGMKYLLLILLIFFTTDLICQKRTDSLLVLLDATIQKTSQFDADKTKKIGILKQALERAKESDLQSQFDITASYLKNTGLIIMTLPISIQRKC